MVGGRAESCGNEDRADLVAVQGGGVRLVAGPGPQDMGGLGVLREFFPAEYL